MASSILEQADKARYTGRYELFFTRLVSSDTADIGNPVSPFARQLQLVEGMPFFVTSDGKYPLDDLNAFFRYLPSDGCHSPRTWLAYARDIDAFLTFLHDVYKVHWLDADNRHLTHYRQIRRGDDAEKHNTKISGSSWNRALAALERLYRFAVEEGWIDRTPFRYRDTVVRTSHSGAPAGVRRNRLRDPEHASGDTIRCITLEQYRIFRDVGLRGLLPDGTQEPGVERRHSIRDALFADMLIETGLRVTEAAGQLTWEVPELAPHRANSGSVECALAPALAKGRKSRKVRVHARLLRRLHEYIEIERANVISEQNETPDAINVSRVSVTEFVYEGAKKRSKFAEVSLDARRRFVERHKDGSVQPVALWLGEHGSMLSPERWRDIFAAASKRCTDMGYPVDVSPHTLRHTFAVNMLEKLIRAMLATTNHDELKSAPGARAYRRLIGDPLRQLQRMLGHRSITTTYRYLTHLDEAVEIALKAHDALQSELHPDELEVA